ncbi:uncharacterized protein LOC143279720 [Babylonia areolata]|uniref:uncharacterized protein LOC143279720 n=1 Tax=Babylonia areolata TaxID=304850 RepID=UPI003FD6990C
MSALPQVSPAGDLFNKGGPPFGSFEYNQKESRSSYDIGAKKKRRAPAPPSGLAQYKPKILSSDTSGDIPVPVSTDSPVAPPRPSRNRDGGKAAAREAGPIVMGDKNVPVVLPPSQHDDDDPQHVDLNVSSLNLTSHDVLTDHHQDLGTDNPLFSTHDELSPDSRSSADNPVLDTHDDNVTTSQSTDNPLFSLHDEGVSGTQGRLESNSFEDRKEQDDTEPEGVYIPAPDYDEEELTMAIPEEADDGRRHSSRRSTRVYKEYDGEDFGQYLSDEENGYEEILRRASRPSIQIDHKSKTEVRRPHYKKRESLPLKNKKDKGVSGFSSLRTFSYADSKFGTVSGNRRQSGLLSGPKEPEHFVNTAASYEQFLYGQNGGEVGPAGSELPSYRQEASPDHPPRVQSRDSVWKKFTWKVKKQMNSFDLSASS